MQPRPEEELARTLLSVHLGKRFGGEPICERNENDPPDLVATLPSGLRLGVEVTQAFQQVSHFDHGAPRSSEALYIDLKRWADAVGDRTAPLRKFNYFLELGPGALALRQDRPRLFDPEWKKESEQAIHEHVTARRTSILKRPGLWLKPGDPGNCWIVAISPGGSAHIGSATTSMLRRAILPKAQMTQNWKVRVDQKWLLVLNNYPLADVDEVRSIARELAKAEPIVRELDGILWGETTDRILAEIPLGADL